MPRRRGPHLGAQCHPLLSHGHRHGHFTAAATLPLPTSAWLVTRPLPVPWTPLRPALGYPGSNPPCPHSLLPPWACCVGTTAPRLHHACNTPHQSSRTKHRFREALWRISGRPPWVTPDLALPRQHGPDTSLAQVQEPGTAPTPNTHLCEAAQG